MMSSVTTSGATRSTFSFARIWDQFGMLVVFAALFIGCVIFVPNFASFVNMKGLGLAISMSGMVACGMLFCLASGDFDLSVASVIACAGVTTAVVINLSESLWLGIAAGLLLGALSGLVNGFVIARLKINALITTLATMQIVRGLAYIISDGKAVGIEDERFFTLGYANWFGLPAPIWLTVACLVVFGLLLNKTTFGRNTLAIGGNEEAARLAGVPVVRTKIIIFVLSGSSTATNKKPNVRPEFKPNFLVYRVIAASARFAGGNYQKWRGWSHCLYLHGSHIINNQLRLAMIRRKQGG